MKNRGIEAVESEIRMEKAGALGRAGEALEGAIQALQTFRQEVFGLLMSAQESSGHGEGRLAVEFEQELNEDARRLERTRALRHALIIQREAVGLRRHEEVDRQYPLPGPLTLPGDPP